MFEIVYIFGREAVKSLEITAVIAACDPYLIQLFKKLVSNFKISIAPSFIAFISHPSTICVCCLGLFLVLTIMVSFMLLHIFEERLAWIWVTFITWIVMGTKICISIVVSFFSQIFLVRSDAIYPLRITRTV